MSEMPPQVAVDVDQDLRSYWRERMRQHTRDRYAGVPLSKLPEDLRTYEHLLWSARPDTVIELGTQFGGSALWFRDRLRTLHSYGLIGQPRVVTVDINQAAARSHLREADADYADSIHVLEGDLRDATTAKRVGELIGKRCLVVEDSAHEYETTLAGLTSFAEFVPIGGYFIVEDGSVDVEALRIADDWPRGVLPAVRDWLQTSQGRDFAVRRDLELYGVTCHPSGFLQRIGEDSSAVRAQPDEDAAVLPHPLELAPVGAGTIAEQELAEALRHIANLTDRLEEQDRLTGRRIADLEHALREAGMAAEHGRELLAERDRLLADVLGSLSWRLTKPLRSAKRLVSRD